VKIHNTYKKFLFVLYAFAGLVTGLLVGIFDTKNGDDFLIKTGEEADRLFVGIDIAHADAPGGGGGRDGGSDGGGSSSGCFLAGTKISLFGGEDINIEDVKVGDKVLSYNLKTSEYLGVTVHELESPVCKGYYKINNELLYVTDDHPIYIKKKNGVVGWMSIDSKKTAGDPARVELIDDLKIGDELFTSSNEWKTIESIEYVEGEIETFNLKEVGDTHTFFANGVLVHNKHGGPGDDGTNDNCP
jgi:hypothetical protein